MLPPNRDRLTYPAGFTPGFDPTHPAAQGISGVHGFSAVVTPSGPVSLTLGQQPTFSGSPTFPVLGSIGPTIKWGSASSTNWAKFTSCAVADTNATIAAILTLSSVAGGCIFTTDTDATGGARGWQLRDNALVQPNVIGISNPLSLPTNAPIFYAASHGPVTTNFIFINLTNGQIKTGTAANSTTGAAPLGSYAIGAAGGIGNATMNLAAVMFSPTYLSMPQLLLWAQDPWAFWYPDAVDRPQLFSSLSGGVWILATGFWNDAGVWVDTAIWADGIAPALKQWISAPGVYVNQTSSGAEYILSPGVYINPPAVVAGAPVITAGSTLPMLGVG